MISKLLEQYDLESVERSPDGHWDQIIRLALSDQVQTNLKSLKELFTFLKGCEFLNTPINITNPGEFIMPGAFEKIKRGNSAAFSLWAWKQLMNMKYEARLVFGKLRGIGKATHHLLQQRQMDQIDFTWIVFKQKNRWFLLDPTATWFGFKRPPLFSMFYEPHFSVQAHENSSGPTIRFYSHPTKDLKIGPLTSIAFIVETLLFGFQLSIKWLAGKVLPVSKRTHIK